MTQHVIYRQINKDYAYWIEKRRFGQEKGGHVAGLLSYLEDGEVKQNILIDSGLGTIEGLADCVDDSFWDEPLDIFITHGHIDHHAELMIISEIYCQRRGKNIYDIRPPVSVYCTADTHIHLDRTHWWGYRGGKTLQYKEIKAMQPVKHGPFSIIPLPVDHFVGAVLFLIEFTLTRPYKIVIGWDTTTLPLEHTPVMQAPSLMLLDATSWHGMAAEIGHSGIEDLVSTGYLDKLQLHYQPEMHRYGAYFVHYSGWEDPEGALSDEALKEKFDTHYPTLANVVRVAERGQQWDFY